MLLAEQLVGEARARRKRGMSSPERRLTHGAFLLYVIAAALILWLVPDERGVDPLLVAGLVAGYIGVSRVTFEFGNGYSPPEQLAFVPLLLLAPLPLVPLLVAASAVASLAPDFSAGTWSRDRWVGAISDCWFCVGPVLLLALAAPASPVLQDTPIYVAALALQLIGDFAWASIRTRMLDRLPHGERIPLRQTWANFCGVAKLDAMLSAPAFAVTLAAASEPLLLLTLAPLVLILRVLSEDRHDRYGKALELQRAYRGTVMLLADVVEFDDHYTASHSRSVVDLVNAVVDRLKIEPSERQEIEFAALLHDVGKIAVPKEILNKPAGLTREEFEVMKRHTIEGQSMLDRVGGLLARVGEIVRSCHERWDGRGYPDGLMGTDIPLAARIVFACDAYNAMTTDRVYRKGMTTEEAVAELAANAGEQFDPAITEVLIEIVEERGAELAATSPADDIRALLAAERSVGNLGATH